MCFVLGTTKNAGDPGSNDSLSQRQSSAKDLAARLLITP
jgi:hypothetical protein